jgi:hypothetical protein
MNPLRGAAWRTRTFLSQPVHDLERSAVEREQRANERELRATERESAAAAETRARLDTVVGLLHEGREQADRAAAENRRLIVALRTQLDEQSAAVAELRAEVDRLRRTDS